MTSAGVQLLISLGAEEIPHPGGTLLDHLDGRATLRDAVGETVEGLVHLYGSCDRAATYPDLGSAEPVFVDRFTGRGRRSGPAATRAFMEITAANELDVLRHNADLAAEHGPALGRLMQRAARHLSNDALAAWSEHRRHAATSAQPHRG